MTALVESIKSGNHSWLRLAKYLMAGGVAFVVDYGGFLLLHYGAGWAVRYAGALSFALSFITSFFLQRQWVFAAGGRQGKVRRDITLYALLAVFNVGLTYFGLIMLEAVGVVPYAAKLLVICVIMVWNYILYHSVIFKED